MAQTDANDGADAPLRPWLGLKAFTAATQHLFFGRTREVRELVRAVKDHPLTMLYGQSGRGKTSLLGAGLIPALIGERFRPTLIRLSFDAQDPPLLAQVHAALRSAADVSDPAALDSRSLWEWAHHTASRPRDLAARPPVLIFDQFEEVFTLGQEVDEGRHWRTEVDELSAQLADLVENRPPQLLRERLNRQRDLAEDFDFDMAPVRVVLALREDYLAALEAWSRRMPSLMRNRLALRELDGPSALEAVVQPGRVQGQELVTDDVGAQIVRFVARRPAGTPLAEIEAVPPLLSLLCSELNEARIAAHADQVSSNQVEQQSADILQTFYQRSFVGVAPAVRNYVEDRLLTVSGHRNAVAREDALSELRGAEVDDPEGCLDGLIEGRLLSADERGGIQRLELTHDVLAPLALRSRNERRERERAERAEREEQEARRLAAKTRRERNRLRWVSAVMALLLLVAAALSWFSWTQMQRAQVQTARVEFAGAQRLMEREESYWDGIDQMATAIENGLPDNEAGLSVALQGLFDRRRDRFTPSERTLGLRRGKAGTTYQAGAPVSSAPIKYHRGPVVFSPDGRFVVTVALDNTVRVWEAASGAPVSAPMEHEDEVVAVAFSSDGRLVVTGTKDRTARIWDAASGAPVSAPMEHHGEVDTMRRRETALSGMGACRVLDVLTHSGCPVAVSSDGRWVVTGSDDDTARVWEAASGAPVSAPMEHQGEVVAVAFSSDGHWVITGSKDDTARVWEAASGAPMSAPMEHQGAVVAVAFSPDGRWVVTGSEDNTARVWEAASGAPVSAPIEHQNNVVAVAFSPDGRWVATGSKDNTARVWEAASGAPVSAPIEHQSWVVAVAFSPDGRWVLTVSDDFTTHVWEVASSAPRSAPIENQGTGYAVAFSPDGRWVVTESDDHTERVWEAATGAPVSEPIQHHGGVNAVAFSPDGRLIVTGSEDHTARVWDATSGAPVSRPIEHKGDVRAVAFSPDGRWVVTGSWDNTARVWEAEGGAPVSAPIEHNSWVAAVAFSPDGRWVVTGSLDNTARVWEAASGAPVSAPIEHHGTVNAVAFSGDGRWVLTGSDDHTARVWDAKSGAPVSARIEHQERVRAVAFSPDGRLVVTGSEDNTVRVWDAASGEPVSAPIEHQEDVNAVAFSPDGRWVLTGSADHTARIWEAASGTPMSAPIRHQNSVTAVAFSPDGRWALTVAADSHGVQRTLVQPGLFPSLVSLTRLLVDCATDRVLRRTRCVPRSTLDHQAVSAALSTSDAVLQSWLRYQVLGDASALFPIDALAGDPAALRARIGFRPGALRSYWEATGFPALGTAWALAASRKGQRSDRVESYFWAKRLSQQLGQQPSASVESKLVRQDLALIDILVSERGHLLLGQTPRMLWYSDMILQNWSLPPPSPAQAVAVFLPRHRAPAQAQPVTIAPWSAVHRGYFANIQDSEVAKIVDALFDHVPGESEGDTFRLVLQSKPNDPEAQYALARLLDLGQGGRADSGLVFERMSQAAKWGLAPAQNSVGYSYLFGIGVGKDLALASEWLDKAARAGHPFAKKNLGFLWRDEYDMPERAIPFFRQAATATPSVPEAMINLGEMLELGWGIERNLTEAESWFRKAADAGLDEAQFKLAVRLEHDLYGPPNPVDALRWYVAAATRGHARAAYRAGQMYEEGVGDIANPANAAGWYRIAAMQGHIAAHYALARLILEDQTLAKSDRPLAVAALQRLAEAEAPYDDKYHDLHWLKGEAGWLARQYGIELKTASDTEAIR
jgi:WD40 repeat protein/TPR repeat protein